MLITPPAGLACPSDVAVESGVCTPTPPSEMVSYFLFPVPLAPELRMQSVAAVSLPVSPLTCDLILLPQVPGTASVRRVGGKSSRALQGLRFLLISTAWFWGVVRT